MRKLAAISLVALAASSCGGPKQRIADEEKKLEIVKASHDADAVCAQSKKVAQAYLDAKDQAGYEQANLDARIACTAADLDAYNRSLS